MEILKMTIEQHFSRYKEVLDAHLEGGGLDPEAHRSTGKNDTPRWCYEFQYDSITTFTSCIYQVQEDQQFRAYIFGEASVNNLAKKVNPFLFEEALKTNLSIPSSNRIYMKPNRAIAIGFRMPADALSDRYLSELLLITGEFSINIFRDFAENKLITLAELESPVP